MHGIAVHVMMITAATPMHRLVCPGYVAVSMPRKGISALPLLVRILTQIRIRRDRWGLPLSNICLWRLFRLCHPSSGNFQSLNNLRLYNNNLFGAIPYQHSNQQEVYHFDLGSNYLEYPDYHKFVPMPTVTSLPSTCTLLLWSSHLC